MPLLYPFDARSVHMAVLDVVLEDVAPAPRDPAGLPDAPICLLFARRVEEHGDGDEAVVRARRADQLSIFASHLGRVAAQSRRAAVEGLDERHVQLLLVPAGIADDGEAVRLRAVGRIDCERVDLDEVPRVADARPAAIVHEPYLVDAVD